LVWKWSVFSGMNENTKEKKRKENPTIGSFSYFVILFIYLFWFNQGIYLTSSLDYAKKYAFKFYPPEKSSIVIAAVNPGNPFPIVEHPFLRNEFGELVLDPSDEKDTNGNLLYPNGKPVHNPKGYSGKACQVGFQSHSTLGEPDFFFILLFFCNSENSKNS